MVHPVVLLRPHDLVVGIRQRLLPVAEVTHYAGHCKQHREELRREAHRAVHQACNPGPLSQSVYVKVPSADCPHL